MRVPAADELFRPTVVPEAEPSEPSEQLEQSDPAAVHSGHTGSDFAVEEADGSAGAVSRRPSGRVRHDEKVTIYVTADELVDIEHARLTLRRHHRLAVDRGRLVREAVAIALADLDENGDDSVLVQRLTRS
ncbi:MAG: hypothetical protein M3393_01275 [Actinomycetota bacterium]|nr:hypothetical protein [Actinomycetota bacterium]